MGKLLGNCLFNSEQNAVTKLTETVGNKLEEETSEYERKNVVTLKQSSKGKTPVVEIRRTLQCSDTNEISKAFTKRRKHGRAGGCKK